MFSQSIVFSSVDLSNFYILRIDILDDTYYNQFFKFIIFQLF